MILVYLGTAACEGWPAMFCECDSCNKARVLGGRNIRTRSQAIIDDKILIDFPADTYSHVLYRGLNLAKTTDLLITHTHSDHYVPTELGNRRQHFAHFSEEKQNLTVHGMIQVKEGLQKYLNNPEVFRIDFNEILPFKEYDVSGYKVIGLPADHDKASGCVIYSVSDGEKHILYANDTGYFPEETWTFMVQNNMVFDFVSLDCTSITQNVYNGHMGLNATYDVKKRMIEEGIANSNTRFCLNHFSHNGGLVYDDLVKEVGNDFMVSYDGLVVMV